jgi:hypothetical protein
MLSIPTSLRPSHSYTYSFILKSTLSDKTISCVVGAADTEAGGEGAAAGGGRIKCWVLGGICWRSSATDRCCGRSCVFKCRSYLVRGTFRYHLQDAGKCFRDHHGPPQGRSGMLLARSEFTLSSSAYLVNNV